MWEPFPTFQFLKIALCGMLVLCMCTSSNKYLWNMNIKYFLYQTFSVELVILSSCLQIGLILMLRSQSHFRREGERERQRERERVLTLWQSPSENSKSNVDNSCWTSFHGQLQKGEMPLNMKPINGKRSYRLHLTKPRQEQAKHDNTKLHQNQVIKQVVITKINFSSNWFFFIISYSQVPCKIMFQPSLISQNLGCEWPNAWKHTQNPCQIG